MQDHSLWGACSCAIGDNACVCDQWPLGGGRRLGKFSVWKLEEWSKREPKGLVPFVSLLLIVCFKVTPNPFKIHIFITQVRKITLET